uniref:Uncharacterized protein n=1 Tax=Vitis vinifera TaxID=29760 RepID=F6I5C0_VITVI
MDSKYNHKYIDTVCFFFWDVGYRFWIVHLKNHALITHAAREQEY